MPPNWLFVYSRVSSLKPRSKARFEGSAFCTFEFLFFAFYGSFLKQGF